MLKREVGLIKGTGREGGVPLGRGKVNLSVVDLLTSDWRINPGFRIRWYNKVRQGSHGK